MACHQDTYLTDIIILFISRSPFTNINNILYYTAKYVVSTHYIQRHFIHKGHNCIPMFSFWHGVPCKMALCPFQFLHLYYFKDQSGAWASKMQLHILKDMHDKYVTPMVKSPNKENKWALKLLHLNRIRYIQPIWINNCKKDYMLQSNWYKVVDFKA